MSKQLTIILLGLCLPGVLVAAEIEGTVNWAQRVTLSTPVSGVVSEIKAQPGLQVKKGDLLLKLEPTNFVARVRSAKAETSKTRYALAEEEREWERAQELYDRAVTSDRDLKLSEIKYHEAKANHTSATAELSMANKALSDSEIKAPFDAVVIDTHVSVAETVVTKLQQVPMITLGMTGRYHVVGSADANTVSKLSNGMPVKVEVNGSTYNAELVFVGVEPSHGGSKIVSGDATNYTVKAEFSPDESLRIGTSASIITP